VADDHGAAGELLQRLFQVLQGLDVQVVGRFVEQDDVAALGQGLGQVTRLRSPPDSRPTFFCWSPPLKLNEPT
jgi:hypothetical protein